MEMVLIILGAIFLISGFTIMTALSDVTIAKEDLRNGLIDFNNGKDINFRKSGLNLNPFALFLLFFPIPKYKDNPEFYSIEKVKKKYFEYQSDLKVLLFGLLGLIISTIGFLIYMFHQWNLF